MVYRHSVTKVSDTTVIMCGGWCLPNILDDVFIGEVTDSDVTWRRLKSMRKARAGHIAFVMNGRLYVAGGFGSEDKTLQKCERYNIKDEKWDIPNLKLPFTLRGAMALTSKDSSFVIITGGEKDRGTYNKSIITFTEKDGFKILNDVEISFGIAISKAFMLL